MQSSPKTIQEYIKNLPEDRVKPFCNLRGAIIKSLPKGFEEQISYGSVGYVVPLSSYPNAYHCDPKLLLPFFKYCQPKEFYCGLPCVDLYKSRFAALVYF